MSSYGIKAILIASLALLSLGAGATDPKHWLDKPGPTPLLGPLQDRGGSQLPADNPTGAPTIPHRISDHQIDLDYNRCMACHGKNAPETVGATPIPESHYLNRDGERREPWAGARYPCTACHVPQERDGR